MSLNPTSKESVKTSNNNFNSLMKNFLYLPNWEESTNWAQLKCSTIFTAPETTQLSKNWLRKSKSSLFFTQKTDTKCHPWLPFTTSTPKDAMTADSIKDPSFMLLTGATNSKFWTRESRNFTRAKESEESCPKTRKEPDWIRMR